MLYIRGITKSFGGVTAVDHVTCTIERGTVTALIGPNGAGKTTLFDIISGLVVTDSGTIHFDHVDITHTPVHKRAQYGMSRTFQHVRLFKYLTIRDHVAIAEDAKDDVSYIDLLKQFGIERGEHTCVSELSYGQRKLLQLIIALQRPHQLLLLDEPVAGVNKVLQEKIESLLLELKRRGETMLIIDHDMSFIRRLADQVIALDAGKVLVEGKPEDVLADTRVLEAYLGE